MSALTVEFAAGLAASKTEGEAQWVTDLKAKGARQFRKLGLPVKGTEQWKYTPLFPLEQMAPRLGLADAASQAAEAMDPVAPMSNRISLINGQLADVAGCTTDGLSVHSLVDALTDSDQVLRDIFESLEVDDAADGFSALNTATLGRGLVVRVGKDVDAGNLLLQWHCGISEKKELFNSRVVIILEEGARLNLVEQYENSGDDTGLLNVVLQGSLSRRSVLTITRVQQQSASSFLVTRTDIRQSADSRFQFTGLDLGDGLARHDVKARLAEPGAECLLNAACMTRNQSHVDHHLEATHVAPNCLSSQLFRAVANDRSKVVFNGKVYVHEGADGTDAKQSSAGLLLSKLAEIDAKPELEIYADEVIAAHGATVGQLDEEALFYLRSRGISKGEARNLLTMAFCRSVTDQLPVEELREPLGERLTRSLDGNG